MSFDRKFSILLSGKTGGVENRGEFSVKEKLTLPFQKRIAFDRDSVILGVKINISRGSSLMEFCILNKILTSEKRKGRTLSIEKGNGHPEGDATDNNFIYSRLS